MNHRSVLLGAVACIAAVLCAAAGATTAKQQFTITTASTGNHGGPTLVAAEGPIEGQGTVLVRSSKDNRVDHMTLRLAKGQVFLVAVEKTYAVHPDPAKCLATAAGHGTFTITGGAGNYTGAHGRGTYVRHGVLYGARNAAGACLGRNAPIAKTTTTVHMTGAVSVG